MIYSATINRSMDVLSFSEDAFYVPTKERESTLLEDAYIFLYESDYNFNTIVNEINFHESAAAAEDAELVLEAADLKTIFNNIKDWIKRAWTRFVNWLKEIKNRIKAFFAKKDKKKPNAKQVKEKLDKAKADKVEIKGVDVDKKKIEEIQSKVENINLDKIEKCKTVEEVKAVAEQIGKDVVGGNISASAESLPKVVENALGLNKEVNLVEKYDASDIVEADENKANESVDKAAKVAKKATEKAEKSIDEFINDNYNMRDSEARAKNEEYNLLMAQANAYRYCANLALTVSTATAKAGFIDNKQIAELSSRIDGRIGRRSKDVQKSLELFRSVKAADTSAPLSKLVNRLIAQFANKKYESDNIDDAASYIHNVCSSSAGKIIGVHARSFENNSDAKNKLAMFKKSVEAIIKGAKDNNVPVKEISKSEFYTDTDKWDKDYYSLVKDLVFGEKDGNGYSAHNFLVNPEAYYHYVELLIWFKYGSGGGHNYNKNNLNGYNIDASGD